MNNIFHVGVHKAATSWFGLLFSQNKFKDYQVLHWEVNLKKRIYEAYNNPTHVIAPDNSIVTNVCCDYNSFKTKIKKKGDFRGIYIYRDPRELIVSTYWSWLLSHKGGHPERNKLASKDGIDRWIYVIDRMGSKHQKIFDAMLDWVENCDDERIRLYRFEDFFADDESQLFYLGDALRFLGLEDDAQTIERINNTLLFKKLSGGRDRNDESRGNHYRSGSKDTYKKWLPKEALLYFHKNYDGYIKRLGYE